MKKCFATAQDNVMMMTVSFGEGLFRRNLRKGTWRKSNTHKVFWRKGFDESKIECMMGLGYRDKDDGMK